MGIRSGELRGEALAREQRRPGPRTIRALRIMFGLTVIEVAKRASISRHAAGMIEHQPVPLDTPHIPAREAVHAMFETMGGYWCEADTHEGAHRVYLTMGEASGLQAIKAALALLPSRPRVLAWLVERRAVIPASALQDALAGRAQLTPQMLRASLLCLEECAHCYFEREPSGGFVSVGCPSKGGFGS